MPVVDKPHECAAVMHAHRLVDDNAPNFIAIESDLHRATAATTSLTSPHATSQEHF
jgi:hypothetical protein